MVKFGCKSKMLSYEEFKELAIKTQERHKNKKKYMKNMKRNHITINLHHSSRKPTCFSRGSMSD